MGFRVAILSGWVLGFVRWVLGNMFPLKTDTEHPIPKCLCAHNGADRLKTCTRHCPESCLFSPASEWRRLENREFGLFGIQPHPDPLLAKEREKLFPSPKFGRGVRGEG